MHNVDIFCFQLKEQHEMLVGPPDSETKLPLPLTTCWALKLVSWQIYMVNNYAAGG